MDSIILTTHQPPNGRGCGSERDPESPYLCCNLSRWGKPIEAFVKDPAIPWPGKFQRGIKILPRYPKDPASVNDVVIFVGSKPDKAAIGYPAAWDFVEEAARFGASRKAPPNIPFEKLTPGQSRMIFCHAKVIPQFEYELNRGDGPLYGCKHLQDWMAYSDEHNGQAPERHLNYSLCTHGLRDLAFLSHKDIEPSPTGEAAWYQVRMPSFTYTAKFPVDPQVYRPTIWSPGLFLALSLTHIEFAKKPHKAAQEKAQAAGFDTVTLDY